MVEPPPTASRPSARTREAVCCGASTVSEGTCIRAGAWIPATRPPSPSLSSFTKLRWPDALNTRTCVRPRRPISSPSRTTLPCPKTIRMGTAWWTNASNFPPKRRIGNVQMVRTLSRVGSGSPPVFANPNSRFFTRPGTSHRSIRGPLDPDCNAHSRLFRKRPCASPHPPLYIRHSRNSRPPAVGWELRYSLHPSFRQ